MENQLHQISHYFALNLLSVENLHKLQVSTEFSDSEFFSKLEKLLENGNKTGRNLWMLLLSFNCGKEELLGIPFFAKIDIYQSSHRCFSKFIGATMFLGQFWVAESEFGIHFSI
jgi:hypothetical protein